MLLDLVRDEHVTIEYAHEPPTEKDFGVLRRCRVVQHVQHTHTERLIIRALEGTGRKVLGAALYEHEMLCMVKLIDTVNVHAHKLGARYGRGRVFDELVWLGVHCLRFSNAGCVA